MNPSKRNGFTLMEALLAMMIVSILSLSILILSQCMIKVIHLDFHHQEQMAILQLRQILACAHSIQVHQDRIEMIYRQETIQITQDKNRLVKKDGYEILMEGVSNVHFTQDENQIFLWFQKGDKSYRIQLY